MQISIIYWNIWLDNQLDGPENAKTLFNAFDELIDKYHPDCFGLNEVLRRNNAKTPFVLDYLKQKGYEYNYFALASPLTDDWEIGCAIVSKLRLSSTDEIILGEDLPAKYRGYPGYQIKAIHSKLTLGNNKKIDIIVSHLIYITRKTLALHYRHNQSLTNYIDTLPKNTHLIIGGDFNESKIFPFSFNFKNRKRLSHRTGKFFQPTWKARTNVRPLRANLDKVFWTKDSGLKLDKFLVVPNDASDHKPLYAEFSID